MAYTLVVFDREAGVVEVSRYDKAGRLVGRERLSGIRAIDARVGTLVSKALAPRYLVYSVRGHPPVSVKGAVVVIGEG